MSCAVCHVEASARCNVCARVCYCSPECQALDYDAHQATCEPAPDPQSPTLVYSHEFTASPEAPVGAREVRLEEGRVEVQGMAPLESQVLRGLLEARDPLLSVEARVEAGGVLRVEVRAPLHHAKHFEYLLGALTHGVLPALWGKRAHEERLELALRERAMAPLWKNDESRGEQVRAGEEPAWHLLAPEHVVRVLGYLSLRDLCRVSMVSRELHKLATRDSLWDYCYWSAVEHVDVALGSERPVQAVPLFLKAHRLLCDYVRLGHKGRVLLHLSVRASPVCSACGSLVTKGTHVRNSRTLLGALGDMQCTEVNNMTMLCHRCYMGCAESITRLREIYKERVSRSFWSEDARLASCYFTHNSSRSLLWLHVRAQVRKEEQRLFALGPPEEPAPQPRDAMPVVKDEAALNVEVEEEEDEERPLHGVDGLVVGKLLDARYLDKPPPLLMAAPEPTSVAEQNLTLLQQLGFIKRSMNEEGQLRWEMEREDDRGVIGGNAKRAGGDDDEEFELSEEGASEELSSEEFASDSDETLRRAKKKQKRAIEEQLYEGEDDAADAEEDAVEDEELADTRQPQELLDLMGMFGFTEAQRSHPEYKECKALWDYDAENPTQLSLKKGDIIVVYFFSEPLQWSLGARKDDMFDHQNRLKLGAFPNQYVKITKIQKARKKKKKHKKHKKASKKVGAKSSGRRISSQPQQATHARADTTRLRRSRRKSVARNNDGYIRGAEADAAMAEYTGERVSTNAEYATYADDGDAFVVAMDEEED